jgi:hypothetical protein
MRRNFIHWASHILGCERIRWKVMKPHLQIFPFQSSVACDSPWGKGGWVGLLVVRYQSGAVILIFVVIGTGWLWGQLDLHALSTWGFPPQGKAVRAWTCAFGTTRLRGLEYPELYVCLMSWHSHNFIFALLLL